MSDLARMEAAADWLVRLCDAPADESLTAAWLKWCEEDPQNLSAFKRAHATWQAAVPTEDGSRGHGRWMARSWLGAAAAALIVGLGFGVLWMASPLGSGQDKQSYSTPIAGRGLGVLPDGSKVELGAGSRITTQYTASTRGVTVDSGEAFFSVTKDAHRPFVVNAGGLTVIAVGTAFNVRRGGDRVVVAVQEGKVRVRASDATGSGPDLAAVVAGEQAIYREQVRHVALAAIGPRDAASWREGILKYEHEPLSSVSADLNRYTTRKIIIRDPEIARLPFTGTVFTARIDDALRALGDVFPVTLVEDADRIEIRRR